MSSLQLYNKDAMARGALLSHSQRPRESHLVRLVQVIRRQTKVVDFQRGKALPAATHKGGSVGPVGRAPPGGRGGVTCTLTWGSAGGMRRSHLQVRSQFYLHAVNDVDRF